MMMDEKVLLQVVEQTRECMKHYKGKERRFLENIYEVALSCIEEDDQETKYLLLAIVSCSMSNVERLIEKKNRLKLVRSDFNVSATASI